MYPRQTSFNPPEYATKCDQQPVGHRSTGPQPQGTSQWQDRGYHSGMQARANDPTAKVLDSRQDPQRSALFLRVPDHLHRSVHLPAMGGVPLHRRRARGLHFAVHPGH